MASVDLVLAVALLVSRVVASAVGGSGVFSVVGGVVTGGAARTLLQQCMAQQHPSTKPAIKGDLVNTGAGISKNGIKLKYL